MINCILFLLLEAGTFYAAILYGSQALTLLFLGEIVFFVLAHGYLFYQRMQIKSTIVVPIVTGEKGKSLLLQIKTRKKGKIPVSKIKYEVRITQVLSKFSVRKLLTGKVDGDSEMLLSTSFVAQRSGAYDASLTQIRIYDLTGIFFWCVKCKESCEFQILPDFYAVGLKVGQASKHFVGETDVYEDRAGGSDQSELFQIREFRNGDKIQSIHWKLSAKADELMVRENKLPHGCAIVLLLDLYAAKGKLDMDTTEAYLQFIASLSFSLLEEKCPHYAVWYSGKENQIIRVRVEKEEDFYLFLMLFYRERPDEKKHDLREEYRQKYRMENYVTDLCVDRELNVWKNGSQLKKLSVGHLEEDCEKLELIV